MAIKMHSMFGSTYVCESTFSTIKQAESKNRNRMADKTLVDSLRIATIDIGIDHRHPTYRDL